MKMTGKILSFTLLVLFVGTMSLSLFHMSIGMDMSGGMSDCPFMSHEEVVCSMDLADHIGAWKSAFASTVPVIALLLAAVAFVAVVSIAPNLLRRAKFTSPPMYKWVLQRTYTFSYRPLQELFSNGILHPKLF